MDEPLGLGLGSESLLASSRLSNLKTPVPSVASPVQITVALLSRTSSEIGKQAAISRLESDRYRRIYSLVPARDFCVRRATVAIPPRAIKATEAGSGTAGIDKPFAAANASRAARSLAETPAAPLSPCPKLAARALKSEPFTAGVKRKFPASQLVTPCPKLAARMLKSEPFTTPSRLASPSSVYFTSICPEVSPETTPSAPSAYPRPYCSPFVCALAAEEMIPLPFQPPLL